MFYLKLCKKKAAYKAKPISKLHLDLSKIKKTYKTSFSTTKLIVIETEGLEIIVQEDGELLFKNSKDKKLMKMLSINAINNFDKKYCKSQYLLQLKEIFKNEK